MFIVVHEHRVFGGSFLKHLIFVVFCWLFVSFSCFPRDHCITVLVQIVIGTFVSPNISQFQNKAILKKSLKRMLLIKSTLQSSFYFNLLTFKSGSIHGKTKQMTFTGSVSDLFSFKLWYFEKHGLKKQLND